MDPINTIVKHISTARYEDLSPEVIDVAKKVFLGIMGAALAGSSSDAGRIVAQTAVGYGGKKSGTILVYGNRVPSHLAALANGVMARCRELDDHHEGGGGHLGVSIVPAVLAIAEQAESPVSGKDLILAIVMGTDLLARLRLGAGKAKNIGWMAETLAPMGVAAVGARLLGLDEKQMLNAIGIAYSFCSGNVQPTLEGGYTLWLPAGTGGAAGVIALDLVRKGFTGTGSPLLREAGLYRLYYHVELDEEALLGDLGRRYELAEETFKPYPCCGYTHHAIYTTLRLMEVNKIRREEVAEVTVVTSPWAASRVGFNEEGQQKAAPRSVADARFSIPYTVASAVVRGRVSLEDFTEAAIADPEVAAFTRKIVIKTDAEKEALQKTRLTIPVDVFLKTVDGRVYSGSEKFPKGDPRNPVSRAEWVDKFMYWASFAAKPIVRDKLLAFVKMAEDLEKLEAVTQVIPYLVADRKK